MDHMLTTVDNPFNPFTNYDQWDAWDRRAGYYSSSLLARVCKSSNDLSDLDQSMAIEDAIAEIVRENVSGMHRAVTMDSAIELDLV